MLAKLLNRHGRRKDPSAGRQFDSTSTPAVSNVPHFVRPRSHFKKGQLKPDAPPHVLKTPDVDNLAKFVLDAVQKKILADDKFVTTLVVHKRWCSTKDEQRTEVELRVFN